MNCRQYNIYDFQEHTEYQVSGKKDYSWDSICWVEDNWFIVINYNHLKKKKCFYFVCIGYKMNFVTKK